MSDANHGVRLMTQTSELWSLAATADRKGIRQANTARTRRELRAKVHGDGSRHATFAGRELPGHG